MKYLLLLLLLPFCILCIYYGIPETLKQYKYKYEDWKPLLQGFLFGIGVIGFVIIVTIVVTKTIHLFK